jgi:hypothetical protein
MEAKHGEHKSLESFTTGSTGNLFGELTKQLLYQIWKSQIIGFTFLLLFDLPI